MDCPYYASSSLSEIGDEIGYLYGVEAKYRDYTLNLDYTSGVSNVSGGDVRIGYDINSNYSITVGVSIPAPNSDNQYNGVLGISYKY
jgi:hypothetical protein